MKTFSKSMGVVLSCIIKIVRYLYLFLSLQQLQGTQSVKVKESERQRNCRQGKTKTFLTASDVFSEF